MKRPFKNKGERVRSAHPSREKARIFSYGSNRNTRAGTPAAADTKSSGRQNGLRKKISTIINYLIVATVLFAGAYLCILYPDAQIKITGDKAYPRDKSNYEHEIDRQLSGSIFYRTKITFDSDKLTESIKAKFPEVNNIKISIPLMRHRPVVEVTLAKPTARLVTPDNTYILDEQGRALFEQEAASASLDTGSLLSINDNSGHEVKLGKPALTEPQISYIREIIGQTSAKGLQPRSFALSDGGTAVDVRFDGLPYFVKFSFDADAKQSSGAFIAVNEQLSQSGGLPKQYIDLRIPEKAFVR